MYSFFSYSKVSLLRDAYYRKDKRLQREISLDNLHRSLNLRYARVCVRVHRVECIHFSRKYHYYATLIIESVYSVKFRSIISVDNQNLNLQYARVCVRVHCVECIHLISLNCFIIILYYIFYIHFISFPSLFNSLILIVDSRWRAREGSLNCREKKDIFGMNVCEQFIKY